MQTPRVVGWRLERSSEPEIIVHGAQGDERVLVQVAGELDLATIPALQQALSQAQAAAQTIVLDLADVSFLYCSGLAGCSRPTPAPAATATDSAIRRSASEPVRHVLDLTRADRRFDFVD